MSLQAKASFKLHKILSLAYQYTISHNDDWHYHSYSNGNHDKMNLTKEKKYGLLLSVPKYSMEYITKCLQKNMY